MGTNAFWLAKLANKIYTYINNMPNCIRSHLYYPNVISCPLVDHNSLFLSPMFFFCQFSMSVNINHFHYLRSRSAITYYFHLFLVLGEVYKQIIVKFSFNFKKRLKNAEWSLIFFFLKLGLVALFLQLDIHLYAWICMRWSRRFLQFALAIGQTKYHLSIVVTDI